MDMLFQTLLGNSNYPFNPSSTGLISTFEAPTNVTLNYGQRVRGYICTPETGNYTFWIASDDQGELWLSTDSNEANKKKIAYVTGWNYPREWTKYPEQQSVPIALSAGQKYYVEAIMKQGVGGDNLAVGWQLPDATIERPIPSSRISSYSIAGKCLV
jgi:hypothetical protein